MKSAEYLIMQSDGNGGKKLVAVKGFIKEFGGYWFGLHREFPKQWSLTELTTGLKCSTQVFTSKDKGEAAITEEIVQLCERYFNGQFKDLFKKDKEMVQKAYLDAEEKYAEMYWRLYGEE